MHLDYLAILCIWFDGVFRLFSHINVVFDGGAWQVQGVNDGLGLF